MLQLSAWSIHAGSLINTRVTLAATVCGSDSSIYRGDALTLPTNPIVLRAVGFSHAPATGRIMCPGRSSSGTISRFGGSRYRWSSEAGWRRPNHPRQAVEVARNGKGGLPMAQPLLRALWRVWRANGRSTGGVAPVPCRRPPRGVVIATQRGSWSGWLVGATPWGLRAHRRTS